MQAAKKKPPPPSEPPPKREKPPPPPPPKQDEVKPSPFDVYKEGYEDEDEKSKFLASASSAYSSLKENIKKKKQKKFHAQKPKLKVESGDAQVEDPRLPTQQPKLFQKFSEGAQVGWKKLERLRAKSDNGPEPHNTLSETIDTYEKMDKQALVELIIKRDKAVENLSSEKQLLQEETTRLMEQLISFTNRADSDVSDLSYQSQVQDSYSATASAFQSPDPSTRTYSMSSIATSATSSPGSSPPSSPKTRKRPPSAKNLKLILKMEHTKRLKNEKVLKEQILELEERLQEQTKHFQEASEVTEAAAKKSAKREMELNERLEILERQNNILKATSETGTHDIAGLNSHILDIESQLKKRDRLAADLNLQIQRLKDVHEEEKKKIQQKPKEVPKEDRFEKIQNMLQTKCSALQDKLVVPSSDEEKEQLQSGLVRAELMVRLFTIPDKADEELQSEFMRHMDPLKDKIANLENHVQSLEGSLKDLESSKEVVRVDFEHKLAHEKHDKEILVAEKEELKSDYETKASNLIESYEQQMKDLVGKHGEKKSKLQAEITAQRQRHFSDIEDLSRRHERALTIEQRVFTEKSKQQNDLLSQQERAQNELTQHQKEKDKYRKQLTVAADRVSRLEDENFKLKEILKKYEKRNKNLDAQIRGLELEIENLTDLWETEQNKLQQQTEFYDTSMSSLRSQRSESRMKIDGLVRLLDEEKKRIEDTEREPVHVDHKTHQQLLSELAEQDLLLVATVTGLYQSLDHTSVRQLQESTPDLRPAERLKLSNKFLTEMMEGVHKLSDGVFGGRDDVLPEFYESKQQIRELFTEILKQNAALIRNENQMKTAVLIRNESKEAKNEKIQGTDEKLGLMLEALAKTCEEKEKRVEELEKELALSCLKNLELTE